MGEMRLVREAGGVSSSGEIASLNNLPDRCAHPMPGPVAAKRNADLAGKQMLKPGGRQTD
jgi:hypothetical protein